MGRAAYKLCLLLLCFSLIYNTVSTILSYRYNGIINDVNTNSVGTRRITLPLNLLSLLSPNDAFSVEQNATARDILLPELYNRTINSVVTVVVNLETPAGSNSSGNANTTGTASGSGFIYDNNGHILTNDHVVEGATSAYVTLTNGNSYSAFILGKDPISDLAVLSIDPAALDFEHLVPLKLTSSSSLKIGQHVIAIGNPLGGYSGTMTEGIVSATNRVSDTGQGFYDYGLIQTDAPITFGNSGGPLLNLDGRVVGVTSGGLAANATFINFAIPSNTILRVAPELIAHSKYKHPWLGISGAAVTPDQARAVGLSQARGFVVQDVAPGSPADLAGIKPLSADGRTIDIVIAIDKVPVRKEADLLNYIDTKSVGDTVVLKLIRNVNTIQDVNVGLQELPQSSNSSISSSSPYSTVGKFR